MPFVQFDERQVDLKKAQQHSKLMSIMRKKDPQYLVKLRALLNIKKQQDLISTETVREQLMSLMDHLNQPDEVDESYMLRCNDWINSEYIRVNRMKSLLDPFHRFQIKNNEFMANVEMVLVSPGSWWTNCRWELLTDTRSFNIVARDASETQIHSRQWWTDQMDRVEMRQQ